MGIRDKSKDIFVTPFNIRTVKAVDNNCSVTNAFPGDTSQTRRVCYIFMEQIPVELKLKMVSRGYFCCNIG